MQNGILTGTQMIDVVICQLNSIPISGAENWIKMVDSIQKLGALRKAFEELEATKNGADNNG